MQIPPTETQLKIIKIFLEKVYGKKADTSKQNQGHDGKDGHWLEQQMGIKRNSDNRPDLFGYEMKNKTTSKTTFGDWSASYRIFVDTDLDRIDFIKIFGKANPDKNNRFAWSGTPVPTAIRPSPFNGSVMIIDEDKNVSIIYNYSKDPRENKHEIVPKNLQVDNLLLLRWERKKLEDHLINKFGVKGWFNCSKNKLGEYDRISFGAPMTYEDWIERVEQGIVIFDCGMREDSSKPYASWRANNKYWNSLIISTYPPFPHGLNSNQ